MKKYNLLREDCILLVIDIQENLAKVMKHKDQVVTNTKILLETADLMDLPTIVTEQYPRGLGETLPELKESMADSAQVYDKISFSAYLDDISKAIKNTNRKKVIITGMETHVCVFQTARDLLEEGYEVFIVKDAVASRTKENFINALEQMKSMGAVITNTETVAFDLLKVAGTEEFKIISKLIK